MLARSVNLIATHSGVRGRIGEGLTPQVVADAVGRFVDLLDQSGHPATVGLARDTRPSGRELLASVAELLTGHGVSVVDFGVVSTPGAKLAAREVELGGLIVITGSHLGPDWNGLKFMAGPQLKPVNVGALPPPADRRRPIAPGATSLDDKAARRHATALCAAADGEAIRAARLRVGLEGGAGSAGALALRELGCSVTSEDTDVTLLLDADGDRLNLLDENRTALDPEATLCLAALGADAHTVVKGADTSSMIDLAMARRGGRVHVTQPGELHLVEGVEAVGADIAGEGNGGVVVPQVGMARDGLAAATMILGLMARAGASLSELSAGLPPLSRRRFTVACPDASRAQSALHAVAAHMGQPFEEARLDVRVSHQDSTWALVRQSATEPVLRVTVESPDSEKADRLEADLRAQLA